MNTRKVWTIAGVLLTVACSSDPVGPSLDPAAEVNVTASAPHLWVGQTITLNAEVLDADGETVEGWPVTWVSVDPSVARVSSDGRLTGLREGTAIAMATAGGESGTIELEVYPEPVAHVVIHPSEAFEIQVGAILQMRAVALDEEGRELEGREVLWSTDADSAATVDDTGVLSGVAAGEALIRASVEGADAQVRVTVVPAVASVAAIEVEPSELLLDVGETAVLFARTLAADGSELHGRDVFWTTTDPTVAVVDGDGSVEAIAGGTAWIIAESEGRETQVAVTVSDWEASTLTAVDEAGLPAVLSSFEYTDSAGVTLTRTIMAVAGELRVAEAVQRYEQDLTLQLWEDVYVLVDGEPVFWGVRLVDSKEFNDSGTARPTFLGSGVFVFHSEVLPGQSFTGTRTEAGWDVTQRINGAGDAHRLTFSGS